MAEVSTCGAKRDEPDGNFFSLQFWSGRGHFDFLMGRKVWKRADVQTFNVSLIFDRNPRMTGDGTGFRYADGDAAIQLKMPLSSAARFGKGALGSRSVWGTTQSETGTVADA